MTRRRNTPALACLMGLVPALDVAHATPSAKEIAERIVNERVQEFGKLAAAKCVVRSGKRIYAR